MDILNVSNLTFNYNGELPILKNLSFNVKNNELISIVGGSGCGKSTIIKLLANIETPTNGDISINSISYMPQSDTCLLYTSDAADEL